MPARDGSGPAGQGPRTGLGLGPCGQGQTNQQGQQQESVISRLARIWLEGTHRNTSIPGTGQGRGRRGGRGLGR